MNLRLLTLMGLSLLPSRVKIPLLRKLFGWKIGRDVYIGFSFVEARSVVIGNGVRVGHLNNIRNLQVLEIGDGTHLRNRNEIFGAGQNDLFESKVRLGCNIRFMSRHFVDASGTVNIGDAVTIAGRGTSMWSHTEVRDATGVRHLEGRVVEIGEGSYVGAGALLIGVWLPPATVVGAGAVIAGDKSATQTSTWIGNPARAVSRRERYPSNVPVSPPDPGLR